MSNKYILAAIGLALVRAGEILVAHSEQFTVDDEFIGGVSPARLGMIDADDDTTGQIGGVHAGSAIPSHTPQITATQITSAELDKANLPWDARIHAGTKTKTQKGEWTRKKGIADATYDAVVAELRQQYPATPAAATPPAVTTVPAVTVPAVTVPAVTVPAPVQTPYMQFADWLARNTGEGKALPASWVTDQFTANGTSLAALATNQEASGQFLEAFRGALKSMGVAEQ